MEIEYIEILLQHIRITFITIDPRNSLNLGN
jgi:hypothetical protein